MTASVDDAGAVAAVGAGLAGQLVRFVEELRTVGIPVSVAEELDAVRAAGVAPIAHRAAFKSALSTTLIKSGRHLPAFDTVFDVFFASAPSSSLHPDRDSSLSDMLDADADFAGAQGGAAGTAGADDDLATALLRALFDGDAEAIAQLAREAVGRFSGMEAGRPVAGTYYQYKTTRGIELEDMLEKLMREWSDERRDGSYGTDPLAERLAREEYESRIAQFREQVRDEIRRRLVDDRGSQALARTLRTPLLEDVDFMHATSAEMRELRRAVAPLARRLAVRLAQRRRHRSRGRLDVRRTMRESLSSGGVPLEPRFRHPRPHKPEIVLLCDISGSVASFARFTLQFVYAMSMQFSKVRAFVFIDDVDEVTHCFDTDDLVKALVDINTQAKVVWIDGHSDYGHSIAMFAERWKDAITPRTSLIVTGDARNNYHASESATFGDLARRAHRTYWLNPEQVAYWDTGDSIVADYAVHCDGVHEVRTLAQLEHFIESLLEM